MATARGGAAAATTAAKGDEKRREGEGWRRGQDLEGGSR